MHEIENDPDFRHDSGDLLYDPRVQKLLKQEYEKFTRHTMLEPSKLSGFEDMQFNLVTTLYRRREYTIEPNDKKLGDSSK